MTRVLLIDNVDSFTYNIADLLHRVLGHAPTIWSHDHLTDDLSDFDAIVVGPGPGRPQRAADMGLSTLALRQHEVPVLGICLGHQGLAHLAGDQVVELAEPKHGRVSEVLHDGTGLFEGVPSPFSVVRYHSLEVRPADSSPLVVTARAADDDSVMALADPGARRWGLQFHPESVLSEHGEQLVANFLTLVGVAPTPREPVAGQPVAVGEVHQHSQAATAHDARPVQLASVIVGQVSDTWALHHELYAESPTAFWLDASAGGRAGTASGQESVTGVRRSVEGGPPAQALRCSVLGDASGPLSYVLSHRVGVGGEASVTTLSTGEQLGGPLLPNLAALRDRWALCGESAALCLPPISGQAIVSEPVALPTAFRPGFVGYLGYELKAELGGAAAHVSPFPDARLVFADRALVVDHEDGTVHAVYVWDNEIRAEQESWIARVREVLAHTGSGDASTPSAIDDARARMIHARTAGQREGSMQLNGIRGGRTERGGETAPGGDAEPRWRHSREAYLDLIVQCQSEIRAGESYEICLTNAATWPVPVDEAAVAAGMRTGSPVPFAAWLRGSGPTVISASPERFVSVTADGFVEARPIKGTRPRGADPVSDAALAHELQTSVKDRAENLMIVDLLRNDLHRVCRSGSVHVPGIFEVESYSTVHQLVSTVRGRLTEDMDCLDVIGTCFPGGSMTGAPKVRTMEILDRLEDGPRGVYSGALGWIGLDGAMDLSIVIRTVTLADGVAEFGVGGAITALSDPDEEYAETLVKAAALTRALAAAEIV